MDNIATMKLTIKKMLVYMDDLKNSIKGLEKVIYLARQCDAVMARLYVISFCISLTGHRFLGPCRKQMEKQTVDSMKGAKTLAAQNGTFKEKIVKEDVITNDINNFTAKEKFDLIVITSRGFGQVTDGSWMV